jgi:hypothetical protein
MKAFGAISIAAMALGGLCALAAYADEPAEYGVRFDEPSTGSNIRRWNVRPISFPINKPYGEFTPAEKARFRAYYIRLDDEDEPPFPADGLRQIIDGLRKAQSRREYQGVGQLFLIAEVDANGDATTVKAIGAPTPELARIGAALLMFTKYKPALCRGRPCRMEFPLCFNFRLE